MNHFFIAFRAIAFTCLGRRGMASLYIFFAEVVLYSVVQATFHPKPGPFLANSGQILTFCRKAISSHRVGMAKPVTGKL